MSSGENTRHRWRVKLHPLTDQWHELPGEHTPQEIWAGRLSGRFYAAETVDPDASPDASGSTDSA